ncbi:Terpene synthase 10 [Morella rubra]|uniref:Terpene synthase 10 n=1 Tax=Morella rubra TaxID=262757 RepID=A0A6A1UYV9_9ROSI|nr:Terpene synthase 10 [Morella rubra]
MENFLWAVGKCYEPQFGYFRRTLTKINVLLTVIDDIYDVYGTLDELELFTDAVERWDTANVDGLPYYMQICFLAVYNFVNETAFDVLKEQGIHIVRQLKKGWADQCRAYLQEAKWYYSGYTPTLQEYMENAWVSVAAPAMLRHAYFSDELERGDVPKSIQCYMKETDATEEEAREYIRSWIGETWKKVNEEGAACSPSLKSLLKLHWTLQGCPSSCTCTEMGMLNRIVCPRNVYCHYLFIPFLHMGHLQYCSPN